MYEVQRRDLQLAVCGVGRKLGLCNGSEILDKRELALTR